MKTCVQSCLHVLQLLSLGVESCLAFCQLLVKLCLLLFELFVSLVECGNVAVVGLLCGLDLLVMLGVKLFDGLSVLSRHVLNLRSVLCESLLECIAESGIEVCTLFRHYKFLHAACGGNHFILFHILVVVNVF